MSPIDPTEAAALLTSILSAASDTGRRARQRRKARVSSSKRIGFSKPQRFSKLASDARKLAARVYPDSWVALYREVEAGRISLEAVDQRMQRTDVIVRGFLNTLMEQDLWRYCQLAGFIAWGSSLSTSRDSLLSYARFVPREPTSVYEFVRFVPVAAARAKRLDVNLDKIFPAQSDREARRR